MNNKAGKTKSLLLKKVMVVFISVLTTLLILELMTQIWFAYIASDEVTKKYGLYTQIPEDQWQISRHHYLNYCLTPNYRKDKMSHNSLGFRGKEFSRSKPDSLFRIVALGGSTTYTAAVNDDELTFTAQLEKILKVEYGYQKVEVINAGVPGYNSWESLINLQFRVLDIYPDLILVYHGTNDVHTRLIPTSEYEGDNSGRRKAWECPEISIYDRSALLRIIRRRLNISHQIGLESCVHRHHRGETKLDQNQLLDENDPRFFERNLMNMIAIAQKHHIQIALATWAHSDEFKDYASSAVYQRGFKEHNDVVKKVSKLNQIPVFNFAENMSKDKKYWADGRHVNEAGAFLKARLFATYLYENELIVY